RVEARFLVVSAIRRGDEQQLIRPERPVRIFGCPPPLPGRAVEPPDWPALGELDRLRAGDTAPELGCGVADLRVRRAVLSRSPGRPRDFDVKVVRVPHVK